MNELIQKFANGSITIDSHSAEYLGRLWFIDELLQAGLLVTTIVLIVIGVRAAWQYFKSQP